MVCLRQWPRVVFPRCHAWQLRTAKKRWQNLAGTTGAWVARVSVHARNLDARGGWTHATGSTHAQLGRTRGLDARESSTHAQLGRTRGLDARMAWTHARVPRTLNLDARGGWKHAKGSTHAQLGRTRGLDAREGSTHARVRRTRDLDARTRLTQARFPGAHGRAMQGSRHELLRDTRPSYSGQPGRAIEATGPRY